MSILKDLEDSFISMNNSYEHTINEMDWSHISQIKPKKAIECPLRHQVKDICINKNCKAQNSLICLQDSCCFRSAHSVCPRQPVLGITKMIQQKTIAIDQIRLKAQIFFDQKQKQLRQFRSQLFKQSDQIKENYLSDAQSKFKTIIDSKAQFMAFSEITCRQSAILTKAHQLFMIKGKEEITSRANQAFKTFDKSLTDALSELKTDFALINEDSKNPSIHKTSSTATLPGVPNFNKPTIGCKSPNPEVSARKRFADFIGQQIGNGLRTPSRQNKSARTNHFDRSGEKGNSINLANSSQKNWQKSKNSSQKTQNLSKGKPQWK